MKRQRDVARVAGFEDILLFRTWGLRPRLYAGACSAGWSIKLPSSRQVYI